jgi:hypothetical protein
MGRQSVEAHGRILGCAVAHFSGLHLLFPPVPHAVFGGQFDSRTTLQPYLIGRTATGGPCLGAGGWQLFGQGGYRSALVHEYHHPLDQWPAHGPLGCHPRHPAHHLVANAAVVGTSYWLLHKKKVLLYIALGSVAAFAGVQGYHKWQVYGQCKMIVYNVPQRQAIDFIQGHAYHFVGDTSLQQGGLLQNFHLQPSRTLLQLTQPSNQLPALQIQGHQFTFGSKKIIVIDSALVFEPPVHKIKADVIVLSGNPKLRIPQLAAVFNCKQYVFDAANSLWKINYWKKDCEELLLRYHSVAEQGAFMLDAE